MMQRDRNSIRAMSGSGKRHTGDDRGSGDSGALNCQNQPLYVVGGELAGKLEWGSSGRRFKSSRPDFTLKTAHLAVMWSPVSGLGKPETTLFLSSLTLKTLLSHTQY